MNNSNNKVSGIKLFYLCFTDYETLRIGGLVFAGVIVVLSVLLLTGNRIRRCGKPKKHVDEEI
uniref:FXYD domain-containing ion transport regulator n=1 Tax=Sinocyclocheilus rhinocerous TaxID=307959 RepID=A0A673NC41_9TELE